MGFSFEFFPPKTDKGRSNLLRTVARLRTHAPEFFSVTYGAGGSTREGTFDTVSAIVAEGLDVAPHLSMGTDDKTAVVALLERYRSAGVRRVVALRGDIPSGIGGTRHIRYAAELVELIRANFGTDFQIEVAAYPEIHPDAPSPEADLAFFQRKVEAGADSAITQYFYNADAYANFIEACERLGIDIPIVPGIMPITNFSSLVRFSDGCGAEIPRWLRKRLEAYGDDIDSIRAVGADVVTRLCQRLLEMGAPGLHFYTMNQAEPTLAVWDRLGLDSAS